MRVMLLTVPSQRDPLTRALREEAIAGLAKAHALAGRRRTSGRTGSAPALTDPSRRGVVQSSLGPAASAACHMASTGGSMPVHSTSCAAAWCTSMPSPSSTVAPAAGRNRQPAVGRGA